MMQIHIPEDIAVKILSGLPVKSLFRFKCVCKQWQSLISDPKFRLSYKGREKTAFCVSMYTAEEPYRPGEYIVRRRNKICCFDNELSLQEFRWPDKQVSDDRLIHQLLGSCNGLLLLCTWKSCDHDSFSGRVYLLNPSTKCYRELPQLSAMMNGYSQYYHCNILSGLCFDESSNDYKTVLISALTDAHVTSLRRRKKRTNVRFPYRFAHYTKIPGPSVLPRPGVLANNRLHWIVQKQIDDDDGADVIVYFDEKRDRFKKLSNIVHNDSHYYMCSRLGVLDGCICMLRWAASDSVYVLVMKEYGIESSWTTLLKLWSSELPMYFTRLGWDILFIDRYCMYAYNLKDEASKNVQNRLDLPLGLYVDEHPVSYVESLESVDWK